LLFLDYCQLPVKTQHQRIKRLVAEADECARQQAQEIADQLSTLAREQVQVRCL